MIRASDRVVNNSVRLTFAEVLISGSHSSGTVAEIRGLGPMLAPAVITAINSAIKSDARGKFRLFPGGLRV